MEILWVTLLCLCILVVVYTDLKSYLIPNWINGVILMLYPAFYFTAPEPIAWQIPVYGFLFCFALGFATFAVRMMGGGDCKLFIALGPWVGWSDTMMHFILYFTLYGLLMSVILAVIRGCIAKERTESVPEIFRRKAPIPYGLAIGAGFITVLAMGIVHGLPNGL
jgi:prepilin peptidase CpaA